HIGDRFGRRAALTYSVTAMAIPTFLIGLLPGYATLGLWAPAALTLLRMVQGLSVGGEYTSSMVFLVEHAPDGRRGLMGALTAGGLRRGRGICREYVGGSAGNLGLAHSLLARSRRRHCGILSAAARSRSSADGAAQARPDCRDTTRSLARRTGLRWPVSIQCGRLLRQLCLSSKLVPNRRRSCTFSC